MNTKLRFEEDWYEINHWIRLSRIKKLLKKKVDSINFELITINRVVLVSKHEFNFFGIMEGVGEISVFYDYKKKEGKLRFD